MKFLLIICFVFTTVAYANERPKAVILDPKMTDLSGFEKNNIEVIHPRPAKTATPPLWKRNSILQESGLLNYVKGYDELDLDLLYLDAMDKSQKKFLEKYKSLPKDKLENFQKMVKE